MKKIIGFALLALLAGCAGQNKKELTQSDKVFLKRAERDLAELKRLNSEWRIK